MNETRRITLELLVGDAEQAAVSTPGELGFPDVLWLTVVKQEICSIVEIWFRCI